MTAIAPAAPLGTPVANASANRRGVLLLVTVCMLTLFLMLGTAYLVSATRARESARALSRKTLFADQAGYRPEAYLDRVVMEVLRGGGTVTQLGTGQVPDFESLLADRYGDSGQAVTGTISSAEIHSAAGSGNTGPVIRLSFTRTGGAPISHPAELNGRILTLTAAGVPPRSQRIIRASGAGPYDLTLSNPRGQFQWTAATIGTFAGTAVINGREFAGNDVAGDPNEAWDGFDNQNPFLAHVEPDSSNVSRTTVIRPSYFTPAEWDDIDNDGNPDASEPAGIDCDADGIVDAIDNDGDGVADGVFLDFGLPTLSGAGGETRRLHASVLITDLDGRFNVNAHGSLVNMPIYDGGSATRMYPYTHTGWGRDPALPYGDFEFDTVPMGSGVGPAEVNPEHLFSRLALAAAGESPIASEEPAVFLVTGGRKSSLDGERPSTSRYSSGEDTPRLEALEGRYGGMTEDWGNPSNWDWSELDDKYLDSSLSLVLPLRDSRRLRAATAAARLASDAELQLSNAVNNGVPPLWWNSSSGSAFDWLAGAAGLPPPRGVFNSPPDLQGRMKTLTRDRLWEIAIDFNGDGDTADPGETPPDGASDQDGDGRTTYGIVPRLAYAKAEWSTTSNLSAETASSPYEVQLSAAGTKGGYLHAPSTDGTSASPMAGNPFTLGELEPLLRPYDIDVNLLPPRLVAMLGSVAEQMRTRLTTESWDTTGLTDGAADGAWGRILDALQTDITATDISTLYGNAPGEGILAGEIARGERFNLNRPLTGVVPDQYLEDPADPSLGPDLYYVQRQAYFKDLYTLLVLLDDDPTSLTADELQKLAQWCANVVEFRDADSTMTPFEYDTNIFDGWGVDGDVTTDEGGDRGDIIWGAERPEIVIASGVGWESADGGDHGEIYISLHRPWNDKALAAGTTEIAGNPVDVELDAATPEDAVVLDKVPTGSTRPIWRIRLSNGATDDLIPIETPAGWSVPPKLGGDDWIGIRISDLDDSSTIASRNLSFPAFQLRDHDEDAATDPEPLTLSGANFPGGTRGVVGQDRLLTVHLERLSCPRHNGDANWLTSGDEIDSGPTSYLSAARYVTVDSMQIVIVSCTDDPATTILEPADDQIKAMENRRDDDVADEVFWRMADPPPGLRTMPAQPSTLGTATSDLGLLPAFTNDVTAYPWPNRPFFSAVELLLVHDDSPQEMLSQRDLGSGDDEGYRTLLTSASETDLPDPLLLDAVTITTPFTGIHDSWVDSSFHLAGQTGIHPETHPVNQLSAYREPGRVNLNTITNDQVWDAVVAGPVLVEDVDRDGTVSGAEEIDGTDLDPHPVRERVAPAAGPFTYSRSARTPASFADPASPTPAETKRDVLAVESGTSSLCHLDETDDTWTAVDVDLNPLHKLYTASRLANVATCRSNLFAVWVTLRESVANDPDSVKYHRGFYIIDRSIPVGFEPGENHNIRNTIRLRRMIE